MGQSGSTETRKRSVVLEVPRDITDATPRAAARGDQLDFKTLLGGTSPVQKSPSGSPGGVCFIPTGSTEQPDLSVKAVSSSETPSFAAAAAPEPCAPHPPSAASEQMPAKECQPKAEQQKPKAAPLLLPIQAVRSRRQAADLTAASSDGGDAAGSATPRAQAANDDAAGTGTGAGPSSKTEEAPALPKLTRGKSAPLLLPSQAVRSRRFGADRDAPGGNGGNSPAAPTTGDVTAEPCTHTRSTCTRSTRRSVTFGATQYSHFLVESDGDASDSD